MVVGEAVAVGVVGCLLRGLGADFVLDVRILEDFLLDVGVVVVVFLAVVFDFVVRIFGVFFDGFADLFVGSDGCSDFAYFADFLDVGLIGLVYFRYFVGLFGLDSSGGS